MKFLLLLFRNMYFTNDITFDFILQRRNYVLSSQPEYTMPTLIFNQGKIRLQYHIISVFLEKRIKKWKSLHKGGVLFEDLEVA